MKAAIPPAGEWPLATAKKEVQEPKSQSSLHDNVVELFLKIGQKIIDSLVLGIRVHEQACKLKSHTRQPSSPAGTLTAMGFTSAS